MPERFLTIEEVIDRVCFSKTHIYRMIAEGRFPRQVKLGPQKAAFLESEILAWMRARVDARDHGGAA
jgi:prophage regulatory protein